MLKDYANLAQRILEDENIGYLKNKISISRRFEEEIFGDPKELISRLTIIDSHYSTQMNKRLFGIEEIAEAIKEIEDSDLKNKAINYFNNNENREFFNTLFGKKYGYNKKGEQTKKAPSLISKYLYFLTEYNFPIYDNLAKESYESIRKMYRNYGLESLGNNYNENYFEKISKLNGISEINDFDKLDNLLWLMGKIKRGSFSLILNKNKYLELVNPIEFEEELKSKEIDKKIREHIKQNIDEERIKNIFSLDAIHFMIFCYEEREIEEVTDPLRPRVMA